MQRFSRHTGKVSISQDLFRHFRIIVRTSLVVVGVKHCSILPVNGCSVAYQSTSFMTKRDRMLAILYVKYSENTLHDVSNDEESGSMLI